MKKFSLGLLLGLHAYSFSFHKISDVVLQTYEKNNKLFSIKSINVSLNKDFDMGEWEVFAIKDDHSRHSLIHPTFPNNLVEHIVDHSCALRWLITYSSREEKYGFNTDHYSTSGINLYNLKIEPLRQHLYDEKGFFLEGWRKNLYNEKGFSLEGWIKTLYDDKAFSLVLCDDQFLISKSQVKIENSKEGVRITSAKHRPINFKKSLLKYMHCYKERQDTELFQHTVRFIKDFKNPTFTSNNEFKTEALSKMINVSKIDYTEDQIKLLEGSEIIAVLGLYTKTYNNKDYVKHWNTCHPENLKQSESKTSNHVIIGLAYDNKKESLYNWMIDLGTGQDISVLFDYTE